MNLKDPCALKVSAYVQYRLLDSGVSFSCTNRIQQIVSEPLLSHSEHDAGGVAAMHKVPGKLLMMHSTGGPRPSIDGRNVHGW